MNEEGAAARRRAARMLPEGAFAQDVAIVTGGGSGLGKAMASRDPEKRAQGVAAVEAAGRTCVTPQQRQRVSASRSQRAAMSSLMRSRAPPRGSTR